MKKDAIAELLIKNIRTDGGTQMRAEIDEDTVDDYVLALADLPPITVMYDGKTYWLVDGFHRLRAHEKAGRKVIYAEVKAGTQDDAVFYAAGANALHGRRRTNADKRRSVESLLTHHKWSSLPNREIARQCGVDEYLVRKMKDERQGAVKPHPPKPTARELKAMPESEKIVVRQHEERGDYEPAAEPCQHQWVCSCAKCGEVKEK